MISQKIFPETLRNLQLLKLRNTLLKIAAHKLRRPQLLPLRLFDSLADLRLPTLVHDLALLLDRLVCLLELVLRFRDFLVDVSSALDVKVHGC